MSHSLDDELPPEGWEPTAADLDLLGEDPRIKLDLDLGTKADEERGLARAAYDEQQAEEWASRFQAIKNLEKEIRAENARARAEARELAARVAKATAEDVVESNLEALGAAALGAAALDAAFATPAAALYLDTPGHEIARAISRLGVRHFSLKGIQIGPALQSIQIGPVVRKEQLGRVFVFHLHEAMHRYFSGFGAWAPKVESFRLRSPEASEEEECTVGRELFGTK
jgi:hypothetical protein